MLTPYLPYPPTSGGQVRSYNLIKNLAKKHKITLFSLVKDEEEKSYLREIELYCEEVKIFERPKHPWAIKNILKTGFGFYPFLMIRNFSNEEKKSLRDLLAKEKFDLIHAENFYVMPHLPKTDIPILLTEQTILYQVFKHFVEALPKHLFWLKPILMIDVWKLKYWEGHYWRKADFLAAASSDDLVFFQSLSPGKKVEIIPNGVDYQRFSQKIYPKNNEPTILFGAADFHWMQNEEGAKILLDKIWPVIKKEVHNARLWIVGKIAPQVLAEYQGQKDILIQEIADSREAYQKSWLLVAPMRSGGGSRTKFFEAMASGLPIITTPEGAEGIPAKNNDQIIIENNLALLAKKTIQLLKNYTLAEKIGKRGKEFVRNNYDWNQSALKLDQLYQKIGNGKN